jgi:hypothetical protein
VVSELTIATMISLQLDLLVARKCWRKSMLFGEVRSDIGEFMQTCGSTCHDARGAAQQILRNLLCAREMQSENWPSGSEIDTPDCKRVVPAFVHASYLRDRARHDSIRLNHHELQHQSLIFDAVDRYLHALNVREI